MRFVSQLLFAAMLAASAWQPGLEAQEGVIQPQPSSAEQLLALTNQARSRAGLSPVTWDSALAAAALKHCQRMASEGPIAHRYGGEMDVAERAAAAGAHFSVLEENVAVGPDPRTIQEGWLQSPGHRANMLSHDVNHVGIAVVAARGTLYAVADYSASVQVMSRSQVEASVGSLIHMSGVTIRKDPTDARAACTMDNGLPGRLTGGEPSFVMRWQGADLQHLPQPLVDRLGSGQVRSASVGSCPARNSEGSFTQYRVAVLLY